MDRNYGTEGSDAPSIKCTHQSVHILSHSPPKVSPTAGLTLCSLYSQHLEHRGVR